MAQNQIMKNITKETHKKSEKKSADEHERARRRF